MPNDFTLQPIGIPPALPQGVNKVFYLPPLDKVQLAYPSQQDVEFVFGPTNIAKWADLENDGDATYIANRIGWARVQATSRVNDRLRGGPYVIPFSSPYPNMVVEMTARLAGAILYESRGIQDSQDDSGQSLVQMHRKMCERWINQVRAGLVRIEDLDYAINIPSIVPDNTPSLWTGLPGRCCPDCIGTGTRWTPADG